MSVQHSNPHCAMVHGGLGDRVEIVEALVVSEFTSPLQA